MNGVSPLYAIAVGAIPSLLAFAYQLNMHHQVYTGNRILALLTTLAASAGWLVSVWVVLRDKSPNDLARWIVVAGIAAPSIYVLQKMLTLLWKWPWPPGKAQDAADKLDLKP
jgi:uncharacterized membrane protein YhdT